MDKVALECLINAPKKDRLIFNAQFQIFNFKKVIGNYKTIIFDLENQSEKDKKEMNDLHLSVLRKERWMKIGFFGGLAGGIIGGLLISK